MKVSKRDEIKGRGDKVDPEEEKERSVILKYPAR